MMPHRLTQTDDFSLLSSFAHFLAENQLKEKERKNVDIFGYWSATDETRTKNHTERVKDR